MGLLRQEYCDDYGHCMSAELDGAQAIWKYLVLVCRSILLGGVSRVSGTHEALKVIGVVWIIEGEGPSLFLG